MKYFKLFIVTIILFFTNYVDVFEQEYDTNKNFFIVPNVSNFEDTDNILNYISSINSKIKNRDIIHYTKKYTTSTTQFYIMIGLFSVESRYRQYANSYLGSEYGRGLGQVSEIALTQYNNINNTNIQPEKLYDLETNIMISCWLYNYYQTHYNLNDLETCMSYNKGVNGYKRNKSDTKYYDKIMIELSKFLTI